MKSSSSTIYKVSFFNQGNIYELYAKEICQGAMFGFVELSGLVFNATSGVVVDPSEERLKNEFSGVNATYIPMHAILRIDEMENVGTAKICEIVKTGSNISHFPVPLYTPNNPSLDK